MNFRNLPNSLGQDRKIRLPKTSVQLTVGSLRKTSEIFFLFPAVKVKANIGGSESIWGHGGRFDGEDVSSLFSWGEGSLVRYRGVIKQQSPDFRSPEVGISDNQRAFQEEARLK